jgi:class 3 adenylate cyclase/tetratricopeptide (TPR) repeat protein
LEYKPAPIDTAGVTLGQEISKLSELLARNAHDNWARLRIAEGWRHRSEPDHAGKEHPNLVPYEELSESEKEYDRCSAIETIKALLAMGYTIQAPIHARITTEASSISSSPEVMDLLPFFRGSGGANLVLLERLWRAHDPEIWAANPEAYGLLAEKILRLGEPLVAYDVVAEGIKALPKDVRLRQLLGLSLARSGASASANAVLTGLYQEGHRDEETLGLLARTHKDLAGEAVDAFVATQHLRRASEFYAIAYEHTGGYWSGINAATLALFLGERERASVIARRVKEQSGEALSRLEDENPERYWLLSTLGEAALLLGDWSEAENWYGKATEAGRGQWGSLQSTRHNARLLALYLGKDSNRIERLFRFPSVVVFAGHMIDRSDRQTPRFPPQIEQAVKNAIRGRLMELNAGFGYASAACGSDILFHEAMLEAKGETHVVLPYEKEFFIKDCVEVVSGADWVERCERVITQAVELQEISKHCKTHSVSYEFANQILHGLASLRAEQLETKFVPLAVWDGQSGEGLGGTAGTVQRWRKLGLEVETIDLRKILFQARPDLTGSVAVTPRVTSHGASETVPQFISEIRALLFADVEGFSKLTDEEVTRFAQHFLGLVGELIGEVVQKPLMKNTWGDGLYFVFSNVRDAGQFALDLRDRVGRIDWPGKGLPSLSLRIGLHAGPVFFCTDPVTQRANFIGAHVSRAARIEPVTPPGQVYASQAFAALAAAAGVEEFRCDYVGQTSMAKNYGVFPTYAVLRRSSTGSNGLPSL